MQTRLWFSKLDVDTSIGYRVPPVEIGLRWMPKLGVDMSHVHMPIGAPDMFPRIRSLIFPKSFET